MSDSAGKSDTLPLTWLGRVPVYASSILVAVLVAGMIATVMLTSARIDITVIAFDPQALQACAGIKSVHLAAGRLTVGLDDLALGTQAVLQCVAAAGATVRHLSSGRANLEDVFLALTGRQLRD